MVKLKGKMVGLGNPRTISQTSLYLIKCMVWGKIRMVEDFAESYALVTKFQYWSMIEKVVKITLICSSGKRE